MAGGRWLGGRWLEAVAGEGWLGAGGRRQVTGGWRRVAEDWLGEVAGGSGWRQVAGGRWLEAGLEVGGWRQANRHAAQGASWCDTVLAAGALAAAARLQGPALDQINHLCTVGCASSGGSGSSGSTLPPMPVTSACSRRI